MVSVDVEHHVCLLLLPLGAATATAVCIVLLQLLLRCWCISNITFDEAEVLLYVHRNRGLIRDGSPGRPPRLSHSS